jgi:LacI family transcriptional regulator
MHREPKKPNTTVTIRDVARLAGLSKSTVANVLKDDGSVYIAPETRRRVLEAVERTGYRRNAVAAALSVGRTDTIGVVLPMAIYQSHYVLRRQYARDVVIALSEAAAPLGLRTTVFPWERHRPFSVAQVTDRRVDGLILVSVRERQFVEDVYATGVPVVEYETGFGPYIVAADNIGGIEAAVEHLATLGHRRIAHWFGPDGERTSEHRREGFLNGMARVGLSVAPLDIIPHDDPLEPILRRPDRPTAIIAYSDAKAFEVVETARAVGLSIPADLSVIGFDDSIIAQVVYPRLTTVHQPLDSMAGVALRGLKALIQQQGQKDPKEVSDPEEDAWRADLPPFPVLPTHLVVRDSTAPPPAR